MDERHAIPGTPAQQPRRYASAPPVSAPTPSRRGPESPAERDRQLVMYTQATSTLWEAKRAVDGSGLTEFRPLTGKQIADALADAESGAGVLGYERAIYVAASALVNAASPEATEADHELAGRAARRTAETAHREVGEILVAATPLAEGPRRDAGEALGDAARRLNQVRRGVAGPEMLEDERRLADEVMTKLWGASSSARTAGQAGRPVGRVGADGAVTATTTSALAPPRGRSTSHLSPPATSPGDTSSPSGPTGGR